MELIVTEPSPSVRTATQVLCTFTQSIFVAKGKSTPLIIPISQRRSLGHRKGDLSESMQIFGLKS